MPAAAGARAARGPLQRPAVPVEVGHLEQQVAPGDPAAAAQVAGGADAVDACRTPPASTSRSATGRDTRARCQKSVSEWYGAPSRAATIRATSASVMPLTSASASRMP